MSFDIRPINQQPMILGAQQMKNDGGGGNLGYMQQGKKKEKEEKEKKEQEEKLLDKDNADSIELNFDNSVDDFKENNETFSAKKWLENVSSKISNKLLKKSINSNPFANM